MNSLLRGSSSALSDVGRRRRHNEDAIYAADNVGLWAVADGMGGHHAGEVASQLLVHTLKGFKPLGDFEESVQELRALLKQVNAKIVALSQEAQKSGIMGTTLALLFIEEGQAMICWVGDSRIYRVRGGAIEQLTVDHSVVQEMVKRGDLHPDDAEGHPDASVITRAIGVRETAGIESETIDLAAGDRYLICSDGLYRYFTPGEMLERIHGHELETANLAMLAHALQQGGRDNISSILIEISGGE